MPTKLTKLVIDRVDLVDEGANPSAFISLFKRKDSNKTEGGSVVNEQLAKLLADSGVELTAEQAPKFEEGFNALVAEQAQPLQAQVAELTKKLEEKEEEPKKDPKKEPKKEEEDEEEVLKSLPPSIRKRLEEANQAIEMIKRVQEEKELATYIAKARELDKLPIKAEEFGPVLKSIAGVSKEAFAAVESLLKACNTAISKGTLFAELGSNADVIPSDDPEVQIETLTKRKVTEGLNPAEAYRQVVADNPELYEQYRNKITGGAN